MKKWVIVCLALLPLLAGTRGPAEKKQPKIMVGEMAPDLPLEGDKDHATLAKFRGHPILIHLWATWCGPCMESMPEFVRLVSSFHGSDLVVLMMDRDHNPMDAHFYLLKNGIPWPAYHDTGRFMKDFGGSGIPATALIDRDGIVRYHHTGEGLSAKTEGKLKNAIASALARKVGAPAGAGDTQP